MVLSVDGPPETAARRRRDAWAEAQGRAWAHAVREGLGHEGRRASGGWPGTLSEARARVDAALELGSRTPTSERERLTRLLNHAARAFWLEIREARDEE